MSYHDSYIPHPMSNRFVTKKVEPVHFVIEGVDRLGKSTLIANIKKKLGHFVTVHYGKPVESEEYKNSLQNYQKRSFIDGMMCLDQYRVPFIFDRFSLGECVYAPLYRGYSGDYMFDLEKLHPNMLVNTRLILLTTSDFSFIQDDGQSFNFENKEKEQRLFIQAFERSAIKNKVIIDVHDGDGKFKDPDVILAEAIG